MSAACRSRSGRWCSRRCKRRFSGTSPRPPKGSPLVHHTPSSIRTRSPSWRSNTTQRNRTRLHLKELGVNWVPLRLNMSDYSENQLAKSKWILYLLLFVYLLSTDTLLCTASTVHIILLVIYLIMNSAGRIDYLTRCRKYSIRLVF